MTKKVKSARSFASDNNAGVHPRVMDAIAAANDGHVIAYGDDPYTARAIESFREHLGKDAEVFFVFGGTGANVLGLKAMTESHHAIICAETAHINVDECGAPEKFTGCKLLPVATPDGKIKVEQIKPLLHEVGFEHHVQPRVISISQATEMGTVYAPREMKALSAFAHDHDMLLHVDGARIANAAASLKLKLKAITRDVGVDVLSFGGAKNGMMYGEAVVFFDKTLARISSTRASRARTCLQRCASSRRSLRLCCPATSGARTQRMPIAWPNCWPESLGKFRKSGSRKRSKQTASLPLCQEIYRELQKKYFFYVWNEETSEVRFMTSFDTTEEDIADFVSLVKKTVK